MSFLGVLIPESDRHLGTCTLHLHRVKASSAHPLKAPKAPFLHSSPVDSTLLTVKIPLSCFPLPNHTQPSSPALHKPCGLRDPCLSPGLQLTFLFPSRESLQGYLLLCPNISSVPCCQLVPLTGRRLPGLWGLPGPSPSSLHPHCLVSTSSVSEAPAQPCPALPPTMHSCLETPSTSTAQHQGPDPHPRAPDGHKPTSLDLTQDICGPLGTMLWAISGVEQTPITMATPVREDSNSQGTACTLWALVTNFK